MDLPKNLLELYAEYGVTAEKAQLLETEGGNVAIAFVALFLGTDKLNEEKKEFYSTLINDVNRQTLGSLLRQIKQNVEFDEKGIEVVDEALKKRNYLAHHYFRVHNFAIFSDSGRRKMLQELKIMQKQFDLAHIRLSGISSLLIKLSEKR